MSDTHRFSRRVSPAARTSGGFGSQSPLLRRLALFACLLALFFVIVRIASCDRTPDLTLPAGEQTMRGLLRNAGVSLDRRGTHVLVQNGKNAFLVESTTVDLRSLEEKEVTLTGTFIANSEPHYLPVLIVTAATAKGATLRGDHLEKRAIRLEVPDDWVLFPGDSADVYTLSGTSIAILTVRTEKGGSLPDGSTAGIGSRIGVRTSDPATGAQAAYVSYNGGILSLRFTPGEESAALDSVFRRVLHSVTYDRGEASGPTPSGSAAGLYCGGGAGVVCPEGYGCQMPDLNAGTGSCVPL